VSGVQYGPRRVIEGGWTRPVQSCERRVFHNIGGSIAQREHRDGRIYPYKYKPLVKNELDHDPLRGGMPARENGQSLKTLMKSGFTH
jgi:hypothetical protein